MLESLTQYRRDKLRRLYKNIGADLMKIFENMIAAYHSIEKEMIRFFADLAEFSNPQEPTLIPIKVEDPIKLKNKSN